MVQHTVGITTTVLALLWGVLVAEGRWEKEYRFDYTYNETVIGWLKLHYIPATWDEARLRCHAEDDVTLLFTNNGSSLQNYENEINANIDNITDWLYNLNLKINSSKTKIMQIRNYKKNSLNLNINIKGNKVFDVETTDFLGISVDAHLNWKSHIDKINSKIASYCYALSVLVDVSSVDVARNAYYGAVLASPLDKPLLNAMNDMVAKSTSNTNCGIFSGIHSTIYKGVYSSVEGIPLSKIPVRWAPGEPVSEYDEGCLLLVWNGTMAVGNCTDSYPYICYKKKTHYVKFTACGTDDKYQLNTKTGSCYKFHNVCQTWRRAYMTCAAEGGHLAIINSPTEAELLKELYAKHPASNIFCKYKDTTMVGFLDWSKDDFWFTIHGETLEEAGYSKWNNGTPDNNKLGTLGQHCGGMTRNGLLNDVWCDTVPFSFICEKNPPIPLY